MKFQGREVDPVSVWENYVDFPPNMTVDERTYYLPLVKCPNPEHVTEKRHFQVNVRDGLVHCFAYCGISGPFDRAIAMVEGVTVREARRIILRNSRIGSAESIRTSLRRRGKQRGSQPDPDLLTYDSFIPQAGLDYLSSRGISPASTAKWELGWDADEKRLVIPAKDRHGRTRFLIRRAVFQKQHPKYLYPTDSDRNRLLFGACQIDLGMVRSLGLVLVEGSVDTIIRHQHGSANTGGILGSYLSEIQASIIANMRPPRIYTMFDKDAAGITATISVKKRLPKIPILVCRFPKGKSDPAELSREEDARVIERAITYMQFQARVRQFTEEGSRVG